MKVVEYLALVVERTFLNISVMKSMINGSVVHAMHQNNDMASFLSEHKVEGVNLKSPMRDRKDLFFK